MKIAQINMSCGRGSTGRIALAISRILTENGIENCILHSGFTDCQEENAIQVNNRMGIRIHQVLARLFGDQGWHSYFSSKRMVSQLKKFDPDIIHLHNLHGYYLNMDVLFHYLSKANKPVIWTLHDCWAFTGHCSHFTIVKCEQWKTHCSYCSQKRAYPYSWFFDRCQTLFVRKQKLYASVANLEITTVSKWLEARVKESMLLGEKPVRTIYNGVDTTVFHPVSSKTKLNRKKIILGVANIWSERKGLNDFIRLADMVTDDIQIVLVGLNQNQIDDLPRNIQGYKRTDSIEELVELYSTADVFFNPSVEETFGLTTVEAMACGTPVVVYNSTASPELVDDATGFVVEPGDVQGAYRAILDIMQGERDYASACREKAVREFEQATNYRKYLEMYQSLYGTVERAK